MAWSGRCPRRRRTATGTGPRPCTGAPTSTARPRSPRTTCRKPRSSPPTASRPPRRLRATDAERDSMAHATATVDVMRPPAPAERGVDVYNLKLGMWVFLASEVMFFTALIGSYIVLRFGASPNPWAQPGKVLSIQITAFNTFLLICSPVSMVKAYASIADGNVKLMKVWLLVTILCGATFVGIQVYEYTHLIHHGFQPSGFREGSELAELAAADPVKYGAATAGLYGSTFFTMTGFHGFHVTCRVISMTYLYFTKVLPGKYSRQDYRGIETIGLYWHFVDLVWIILFTIVYLI